MLNFVKLMVTVIFGTFLVIFKSHIKSPFYRTKRIFYTEISDICEEKL